MIWVSLETQLWKFPSPDSLDRVINLSSCFGGGGEDEPPHSQCFSSSQQKYVDTAWSHTGMWRNI